MTEETEAKRAESDAPPVTLADDLDALNAQITKQASLVRQLKKDGAVDEITAAIAHLQTLKARVAVLPTTRPDDFLRRAYDNLAIRKMYIVPSFEIHGGVKGLFDLVKDPPTGQCFLADKLLKDGIDELCWDLEIQLSYGWVECGIESRELEYNWTKRMLGIVQNVIWSVSDFLILHLK